MNTESHIPENARILLEQYGRWPQCICDLAISSANAIERALTHQGVAFPGNGFAPGALTRNYSRNEIDHFPDTNLRIAKKPKLQETEAMPRPKLKDIREERLARIRELVGDETGEWVKSGYIARLLDRPEICQALIASAIQGQTAALKSVMEGTPYQFRKHELPHTRNRAQHAQRATSGSYILRAFAPDDLPAISLRRDEKGDDEMRKSLIRSLPIDPDNVPDETIEKLWLAPPDFHSYTPHARNRYKLAIRERFLVLFAEGKPVHRLQSHRKTARILSLTREDGQKRIAIFRTVTESQTTLSGQRKPRKRYHKISKVACSIFETREEALRSQLHALEGLAEKIDAYTFLHETFEHFHEIEDEDMRKAVIAETLGTCQKKQTFYDEKLCALLATLFENTRNALMIRHITATLFSALQDALAKKYEIGGVRELLLRIPSL